MSRVIFCVLRVIDEEGKYVFASSKYADIILLACRVCLANQEAQQDPGSSETTS